MENSGLEQVCQQLEPFIHFQHKEEDFHLTWMYPWLVGVKVSSTGVGHLPSQR